MLYEVITAAGEGDDLGGEVRVQLAPGGRALEFGVEPALVLAEADELQRHDVGALVQELVERVLAVRAGLAEYRRPARS